MNNAWTGQPAVNAISEIEWYCYLFTIIVLLDREGGYSQAVIESLRKPYCVLTYSIEALYKAV